MKDRLNHLIETEGLTPSGFADKLGINRPTMSHVLSGRNHPGYDFIRTVLLSYPRLNAEWLLLGKGSMYKHPPGNVQKELFPFPEQERPLPCPTLSANAAPEPPQITNRASEKAEPPPSSVLSTFRNKNIERIIVFYGDKTFAAYQPEEDMP
ncbi:MAG: helix-turn-helix domain-containing protein [Bacteroidales bacterium]|jgi:transcriptional regulator with XRE-family HTH domain|nr:helix-turn-helix domain-containing protein [Bacteroidales bacterium]